MVIDENQKSGISNDPLDMRNYRIEHLPKRENGQMGKWMATLGPIMAIFLFILFGFVFQFPFITDFDPEFLSESAKKILEKTGEAVFVRNNGLMLAIFVTAIFLWITEAIPNYLTSLILIVSLVLTGVVPEEKAYSQLGHPVMWLNIMSFVLASMLVATGVAKRFALWFIFKFGKSASSVFLSFLAINVVLSILISATTAKAAILLPIFMVVAAIYGAGGSHGRSNFGRSLVLQNLLQINIGASGFLTGSGANLLAASLIAGATGATVFFSDWMIAMFPVAIGLMLLGYLLAMKAFFPLKAGEDRPMIEGGMNHLQAEYQKLGPMGWPEYKAILIFGAILLFWTTDRLHGISPTAVAFVGAILTLLPRIGVLTWNQVDIPWHLMIFSAGAYALGAGFSATSLPELAVNSFFESLAIGAETPFWVLYLTLTGLMIFSALIFQSKTMRAMIFVPIAIGVASRFGYPILSLALPVAFMIEHVYVLPFNSKPAALLYETNHYSISDSFRFGISIMIIAWLINILAGETWFRFLGITPSGVFNLL